MFTHLRKQQHASIYYALRVCYWNSSMSNAEGYVCLRGGGGALGLSVQHLSEAGASVRCSHKQRLL